MNEHELETGSWDDFRACGLLWFVNRTLHVFGWALVCSIDDSGRTIHAYPARVSYRGFNEDVDAEGYAKVEAMLKRTYAPTEG